MNPSYTETRSGVDCGVKIYLSGRPGCGKDSLITPGPGKTTVWDLVGIDSDQPQFVAVGQMIREVTQRIMQGVVDGGSFVELAQAEGVAHPDILLEAYRQLSPTERLACDPWDRSEAYRNLLQVFGTSAVAPSHWADALDPYLGAIPAENHAYSTGVRKVNEADTFRRHGWIGVRVDVSVDTCIVRISGRDGFAPTRESFEVPAEVELDGYDFDYRIDGEQPFEGVLADLAEIVQSERG